ncbi:hypothetical protein LCGC14_2648300 [marine sediment metagenome]|uniref:WGR domain-containing protein n=1 Tax=marine sediment metagenome TaxID=412755 RepID=A0A0F9CMP1_9ZZZZ
MNEYRVVSNGLDYRVQWSGKTWVLRRLKWYWLRHWTYTGDYIAGFSNEQEAKAAIQIHIKNTKAEKQGYIPI